MGAKITKFLLFIAILFCLMSQSANAQQLVRVAISNNNFKSYVHNEIPIVATAEYTIYNKKTALPIIKFLPTDVATIKVKNGKINIFANGKQAVTEIEAPIIFDCPYGLLGVDKLKRRGKQALYHGIFEIDVKDEQQFYLVNILDIQEYLKGVVPNEMPVRFGLEALKAQAVAARNYVLMPRTRYHKEFDVDDSVASQVYFGANTEHELATRAVKETQGIVALYDWNLILAQYCSTAGGYTEDWHNAFPDNRTKMFCIKNPKPYLKGRPDILSQNSLTEEEDARAFYMSKPDSYDMNSPYYRWKKEYTIDELNQTLPKMLISQSKTGFVNPTFRQDEDFGTLKDIKVIKRGVSGKVMELEIVSDKGKWKAKKELVIRRLFPKLGNSLPSANVVFDITRDENNNIQAVTAYGGGFGHGVGMSQFGAGFMALNLHKTFDSILKRYYTGISLGTSPVILSDKDCQNSQIIEFFAPSKNASIIVDNKYQIKNFSANINNANIDLQIDANPLHRYSKIDISNYIKKGYNSITVSFPKGEKDKALRLYVELIEKDECKYNF